MKQRKYIAPDRKYRPLVTRLGTLRFMIDSIDSVYIAAFKPFPVESGRFCGQIQAKRVKGKWSCSVADYFPIECKSFTPRREQLLLRACERALKNIHSIRFKETELVRINNLIVAYQGNLEDLQRELDRLLGIETELK